MGTDNSTQRLHEREMQYQRIQSEKDRITAQRAKEQEEKLLKEKELALQYEKERQEKSIKEKELKDKEDERKWQEKMLKMKQNDEKLKREHEEKMKSIDFENEKKRKEFEKDLIKEEIARLNTRLTQYNNDKKEIEQLLNKDNDNLRQSKIIQEQLLGVVGNLEADVNNMKIDEYLKEKEMKLCSAKLNYDQYHKKVKEVLSKTGVSKENASDFLRLVHEIIPITLDSTDAAYQLESYINTMQELLNRRCQDKYGIEDYFKNNKLENFIELFVKELGANYMEELQFSNDEYTNEIEPEIKKIKPKLFELKAIKKVCTEGKATWEVKQNEMVNGNKQILLACSPVMSSFFENLHQAMKESNDLLALVDNNDLIKSSSQKMAYQLNANAEKKAIKYDKDVKNNNQDNDGENENKEDNNNEENENKEDNNKEDNNGENENKEDNNNGENKNDNEKIKEEKCRTVETQEDLSELLPLSTVDSKVAKHDAIDQVAKGMTSIPSSNIENIVNNNRKIVSLCVHNLCVVKSMEKDFDKNENITAIKSFAKGIEDTCLKIIKSRATLREGVLLIQEILKYKPGNTDDNDDKKKLWNAIDNGCKQILKTTIDMIKTSANFFGFFLKFQSSFNVFIAYVKNNPNISFEVSLSELKRDLSQFIDFQKDYSKSVKSITKQAFSTLSSIIATMTGYEEFTTAKQKEELYWEIYEKELNSYRKDEKKFYEELNLKRINYRNANAEKVAIDFEIDTLNKKIQIQKNQLEFIDEQCTSIQKNLDAIKIHEN